MLLCYETDTASRSSPKTKASSLQQQDICEHLKPPKKVHFFLQIFCKSFDCRSPSERTDHGCLKSKQI